MAREDVGKALEALADEDLRQSVANGSLDGLGHLELTEEEQSMLVGAASDYPEASGFAQVDFFAPNFGMPTSETFPLDKFGAAATYAFGQPGATPGTHLVM